MTRAPERPTLRLAHRGDWRRAPENTIAALLAAFDVPGCDGLEFDVRTSGDGVPVLLHDLSLARVQGVDARVGALTADALGSHGVPTLAAALRAIDARRSGAFLDVELKSTDHGAPTAGVLRAARGDAPGDAVVSSFEDAALRSMADVLPGWRRWLNADDLAPSTIARAVGLGCSGISVQFRALDREALARARDAGLDVAAWTIRTRAEAERVSALGVVAMCVEDEALDH
jgi:glycerophosphoryl diester phosphodiesterase